MATPTIPPLTTSTNLGPMITPMSFPNNCLSSLYDFNTLGLGLPWTYQTQGCALSTCCPSGHYYTQGFAWLTSYYSPGVCPEAYRTCSLPPEYNSFSAVSGESIALCCPYDYGCPGTVANGACFSLLSTSTSVVVLDNIFDQSIVSTRELPAPSAGGLYQVAYPIQVRWKASDWESKTGATMTSRGTSPSSSGPAATSPGTSAPSSSSQLSTGSIVGIVTGCVSAVVGVLGLALRVYKWKHPKKQPAVEGENGEAGKRLIMETVSSPAQTTRNN